MIRYDLTNPATDVELVAMYRADFDVDVGRLYTYVPELKGFQLHYDHDVVLSPAEMRYDADVRFYLQVHGQNPTGRARMANIDFQLVQRDEINWA